MIDTLWCESCGEAAQEVSCKYAGLCGDCYGRSISDTVLEASGDHICGHPLYFGGEVFAVCTRPHGSEHDHGVISYSPSADKIRDAAPELLAALIDAKAMLEVYTDPRGRVNPSTRGQALSTIRDAAAAIAKVEG